MGKHVPNARRRVPAGLRTLSAWALCVAAAAAAVACKEASAAELVKDRFTLAERSGKNTLHWNVDGDGDARAVVTDDKQNVIKQGVAGQVTFYAAGAEPRTVELEVDPETGILRADGPELPSGVTEMRYTLKVNGTPRAGALHMPGSGTKGLREAADAAASSAKSEGAHGGTIQVAGGKTYEVVADSASGEIRVYPLESGSERPKGIELALDADTPKRVALIWHADGYYFASVDGRRPPRKVTLVVLAGDDAHVVLVGYRPGVVVVVDTQPVFWAHRGWHHPGLRRGHFKGTSHGPPGHQRSHDSAHEKLSIKSKRHGKDGHKVEIKLH